MTLVKACSNWPLDELERQTIADLLPAVQDWSLVLALVLRHRVAGMVSNALLAVVPMLPNDVRNWCIAQRDKAALLELAAAGEAQVTLDHLADQGIAAELLKGPAVSIAAFGRLGLRTNRDIDILVDTRQRLRAADLLEAQGWVRIEPARDISDISYQDWLVHHKDFVFVRPGGRVLELHWRLFNNPGLLSGLEHAPDHMVRYGAFRFHTLPPSETLLYLCTHGAEHAWSRLKWLADVAALLRQLTSNQIEDLLREARRHRVYPAVAQAMLLSARHLGLRLPEKVRLRLSRHPRVRILVWIGERSLLAGGASELEDQRFATMLKNLSHYFMATGRQFLLAELRYDLMDLSAAGLPDRFRWFGPFARLAALVSRHAKPSV